MLSHDDQRLVSQIPAIRTIGRARLADVGELEDFVQETLLRACTRREQLADTDRLPQWVHAIARNTAINWNRDRRYLPILSDAVAEPADGAENACARMEAEERFGALRLALTSLTPRDREMLTAHVVDGVDYRELQRRYGLSNSAVGVRLHRAKRRVRQRLGAMLGVVACWVGLGARQAMGATIMTTRWKAAALVGAVAGAAVVVGVWQGVRPERHDPLGDTETESSNTTDAVVPRRERVKVASVRPDRPIRVRNVNRQQMSDSSAEPTVTCGAVESTAQAPTKAVEEPAIAADTDTDESVVTENASGGSVATLELDLVVGEIVHAEGGVLTLRLADGTTAGITSASGAPFPNGAVGGTVSFEAAPSSEQ
jgi:RNA polymerase sigma-70 factor (ECF subfamily)